MTAYKEQERKGTEEVSLEFMKTLPIVGNQPRNPKEEEFLREICEFEFLNIKEPGVSHQFSYGNTKKHRTFTVNHGMTYKFPRFLARHLENCSTPLYEWRPDGLGKLIKKHVGNDPRFQMRQVYNHAA
jgi:hypothetical protein